MLHDRVRGIFRPGAARIRAVGDALGEGLIFRGRGGVAGGGVDRDQRRRLAACGLEAGGVVPVHHGGAGEHGAQGVRQQGVRQLLPVNQIFADGVAPGHVAPFGSEWVVLEEEMVLALEEDEAVRVVQPVFTRRKVELRAVGLSIERRGLDLYDRALIGLCDVIHVDMSPSPGLPVYDFDARRLPIQILDIPGFPLQALRAARPIVRAGRSAHDFAIDQQIDAGRAGVRAAAQQKRDEFAFDFKLRRGQSAGAGVAAGERVHQAPAMIARYRHLPRQRPLRRPLPEGRAGGRPAPIVLPFEILEKKIRPLLRLRHERRRHQNRQYRQMQFAHSYLP